MALASGTALGSSGDASRKLVDRDRLVCIGRVSGAHGMEGEIKVVPVTDAPQHYQALQTAVLDTARGLRLVTVESQRDAGGHWVMKLPGFTDRTSAEGLKGSEVLVEPADVGPLAENEYFTEDLIGCTVVTVAGVAVGKVASVMEAGAQHLLQIKGTQGEVLVPLVEGIVKEVRLDTRTIRIDPPPGLLELNEPD